MSLRVLHIVESLEPDAGSVAISLTGLSEGLSDRDVDSHVVAAHDVHGQANPDIAEQLASRLAKAEVLHIHGWGFDLAREAASSANSGGTPYVISPLGALCEEARNGMPWSRAGRVARVDRRLIGRAHAVCSLNEFESEHHREHRVHENILALPYGLSTAAFSCDEPTGDLRNDVPTNAPRNERCLLMLGPIHPIEGTVPLLKAFSEVGKVADGWTVVVAGREENTWRQMLEAAVRRKGGEDRVRFMEAPDVPTQQSLLQRASLVAAPGLRVRFPLTVMQAAAAGTAVLATTCTAPDELGDAICVCNPVTHEIKTSLRKLLLLSDDERRDWGSRARAAMIDKMDWSVRVADFTALYQHAVESKSVNATI